MGSPAPLTISFLSAVLRIVATMIGPLIAASRQRFCSE
jgi:hypothetical protein